MVVVKDSLLLLVISLMVEETRVNGSGLPGRHVQVHLLMSFQKIAPPFLRRSGGGEDGGPRNLFPRHGLGEVLHWERLEPALEGTGAGEFRLDSPAEEASTLVLAF